MNVYEIKSAENLKNLKILSKKQCTHLHSTLFIDLAQLRRLFLENCDFTNVKNDSLKILVNLEVLVVKKPKNCSHVQLDVLNNLKYLELHYEESRFENLSKNSLEILNYNLCGRLNLGDNIEKMIQEWNLPKLKALNLYAQTLESFNLDWLNSEMPNLRNLKIVSLRISRAEIKLIKLSS